MHDIAQNKILIAQPFLQDPFFRRSVILMAEHHDEGSIGFVMNRPLKMKVKDLLSNLKEADYPLYHGGPVAQDQLFFVHKLSDKIRESVYIGSNYYWNGNYGDLIGLICSNKIKKSDVKFFIGYSGWGEGQLEGELNTHSWMIADADYKNIMKDGSNEIWGNELKKMGSKYANLSKFPDDPWLN
ncbi:MAG: YqgE/AlgH family protein [Bacteroidia bacterium]|nr:YqgE/AlgH family protein [Bacteroidia bacterium]